MKACDHFSSVANSYALRRPQYPDELFAFLAGVASGHDLAWDCAAGSGQATIPLARHFRAVVGTDISSAMLAQAPRHPAVEYRTATAYQSGLGSHTADLVTVAQALHWLDLEPFYIEVDRVLRPGGVLAVWTYGTQVLEPSSVNQALERFYQDVVGPYWPPERRHVESGYQTLPFPYPELEHPTFQMQQQWTLDELLGYVGTWSATQLYREAKGVDPVADLARELGPLWGDPRTARSVSWPLSLRVGRQGW
jgi:ubiquinone/menaquinone biosynthesis C-methylase UbiE